jgi:hypothetical protein
MTKKLTYNRKIVFLSALVAALAIIYILTFVFDPANRRSAAFAWLDSSYFDMADRIEIYGINGNIELVRRNNVWSFSAGEADYPVKQGRVEDLFAALSRKDIYPLRAASQEARQRLGLTEDSASRIIIRGGAGLPLLDLMIGRAAAVGSEIYLRRGGWNEIYSGEDRFTFFTDSGPVTWYDLRLFPASENGRPLYIIDDVQQADIRSSGNEVFVLRRMGAGWIIVGNESAVLENTRVDAWLRSVLEAEGEDFAGANPGGANLGGDDFEFINGGITLWFGDGTSRAIQPGLIIAQNKLGARISGSPYTFIIGERTFNNLFRESAYFIRE